jgi:predicted Zn-dependent protease
MVDRNFPKTQQQEILKAINEWNVALNGQMVLQVVDLDFDMEVDKITRVMNENGIMILSVPSYGAVMRLIDDGSLAGKTDRIGGNVVYILNDRVNEKTINVIALHEIGHLLGAEHSGQGLMRSSYHPNLCIDKETIEQVARFNGIDVNKMNYCSSN